MVPPNLTFRDLGDARAIQKKLNQVVPDTRGSWWKLQAENLGPYQVLEAQLRLEAHLNHVLFLDSGESPLFLTEEGQREQEELLALDDELVVGLS